MVIRRKINVLYTIRLSKKRDRSMLSYEIIDLLAKGS